MVADWAMFDHCGVCPRCRRVVPADRPCDLDGSPVRAIRSDEDKQVVIDAVWGTPAVRAGLSEGLTPQTTVPSARVISGLTLGTISVAVTTLAGGQVMLSFVAGLTGLIVGAFAHARVRNRVLIASGGVPLEPQPRFAAGQILACDAVLAPGSATACAAWAVELRYDGSWGSRTTLRVGGSAGFVVALDGGEHIRIPAGALWIAGPLPQLDDLEGPSLEELLRALDRTRTHAAETWPLFQFNIISEQTLHVGERIEILGEVDRELIAGQPDAMYRDTPASMLVPKAVPTLRLVQRKK